MDNDHEYCVLVATDDVINSPNLIKEVLKTYLIATEYNAATKKKLHNT